MRWALLAIAVLLGPQRVAADPIGAERCGQCHPAQYQQWKSTGHASAFARLSKVQQADPTCRSCHTLAPASADPSLAGVQCESCHGTGDLYSPANVMRDAELRKLLGLAKIGEETCAPCHAADTPSVKPWDFAAKLMLVRHSPPKEKGDQ